MEFAIHAIYHQKFMSASVRFLATKPRRVYLFPVNRIKKNSHKKRAPITLLFAPNGHLYLLSFMKNSILGKNTIILLCFSQGVPFHAKKNIFLFLMMRL